MRLVKSSPAVFLLAACSGGGSGAPSSVPDTPTPSTVTIAEIQGSGPASPLVDQAVSFSGVVTGDFQDNDVDDANNLGGFFVQQEDPDANAETSDAVFVFDGDQAATDVSVGDRVSVSGRVSEYFGETQVVEPSVSVVGRGTIDAQAVSLPVAATVANSDGDLVADLERYEGMLLRFPQTLFATDLRELEEFGAVGLSEGGRLYQFTNEALPDPAAYASHKASNAVRSLVLDDGGRSSNRSPNRYLRAGAGTDFSLRAGDTISELAGNLRYSRGSGGRGKQTWRLMPSGEPRFASANPRPGTTFPDGNIRVASFNVLNFFSTLDTGQSRCGPEQNQSCRGADSIAEQQRQLAKIVTALNLIDADIAGLVELENNDSESLETIVEALNAKRGQSDYDYVRTGAVHNDAIKTGFIFKTATIGLRGSYSLLDRGVDSRFNDARNRPALAQTFEALSNGAALTVVLNHLKSKGSSCEADGDPNLDDGQGNCNQTRNNAAVAISSWLADDPTGSGDPDFLVIGDLNAHRFEDPLITFENAGFTRLAADGSDAYSFVFDGQAGALDHALASASLVTQVVGTVEWHINADEPALLDYNLENGRDAALFDADSPFRASDHDPIVIGLDLSD
ncbi:MAG: ExeM/NucH family extracellular endonuclease [Gammaproteobacteria bacterium]|nr:ExeM/NucH family extracellular endonuclease [Gammaproteobacteria bacterium]